MRLVALGYPTVEPVLPDIVRWLRVADSPVADAFSAFLAEIGEPAVNVICWRGLHPANSWVRNRILREVLPRWPREAIQRLTFMLTTTATQPDAHNNDLLTVQLLARHQLVDVEWLRGWLAFKEERLAERSDLLRRVKEEMAGREP